MLRRILSVTILLIFLAWVGWYVQGNRDAFAPLLKVTWTNGLNLSLAFLLIIIGNGLYLAVASKTLGIRLIGGEYISLSFASSFANYFLPFRGGTGIRALYMNQAHDLPIAAFVSTLSIMYVMHLVVNGMLGLLGMGLIAFEGGEINSFLFAFFAIVVLFGFAMMSISLRIDEKNAHFPLKQLAQFSRAWQTVRGNRPILRQLWFLMLLVALATAWQCHAAFDAIARPLSWGSVFVYAASKNLAALIGFTPGALGIVELVSVYLGKILGYTTADALSAQGLIRGVAIGLLLVSGPLSLLYLKRHLRKRNNNAVKANA